MPTHVAFLRAINVGGRRVTKDELARLTTAAGFSGVSTFLASGNILLDASGRGPAEIEAELGVALEQGLGYTVEVFVRDALELREILERSPFSSSQLETATSKPQVGFLRESPAPGAVQEIESASTPQDLLRILGRELHWLPVGGMARAAFDPNKAARTLGPMTIRTQNTVRRLLAKLA